MEFDRKKEIRKSSLVSRYYYYLDLAFKVTSERVRDTNFFVQRILALIFSKVFLLISVFFINPLTGGDLTVKKFAFAIPRIIIGLFFLFLISPFLILGILIGGTIASIMGFRNIVDYSFKEQVAAYLSMVTLLLVAPALLSKFMLYQLCLLFCNTLILIGFDFLYGLCGILSLGHAAFVLFGSYITAFLINGTFGFKFSFFVSMIISSIISFLFGILLGLPSLRVKDYYLVVITISFMIVLPLLLKSRYLAPYSGLALGGLFVDSSTSSGLFSQSTQDYFLVVGVSLFLIIFAYNILHHSQIGRAFRTIKCDTEVSIIFGIPVVRYKLLAFAISAFYASIAGSLLTHLNHFIAPDSYTLRDSIDYIVAAVISGPGSILGSTFGGLFLTFEGNISEWMAHRFLGGDHLARMFYGGLMIIIVFIAPRGLMLEFTQKLKSNFIPKPRRGAQYVSPPPDYDFLEMKSPTIRNE